MRLLHDGLGEVEDLVGLGELLRVVAVVVEVELVEGVVGLVELRVLVVQQELAEQLGVVLERVVHILLRGHVRQLVLVSGDRPRLVKGPVHPMVPLLVRQRTLVVVVVAHELDRIAVLRRSFLDLLGILVN